MVIYDHAFKPIITVIIMDYLFEYCFLNFDFLGFLHLNVTWAKVYYLLLLLNLNATLAILLFNNKVPCTKIFILKVVFNKNKSKIYNFKMNLILIINFCVKFKHKNL